jgi:hypothetical protein
LRFLLPVVDLRLRWVAWKEPLGVPAPGNPPYQTNNQTFTIAANDNSMQTSSVFSVVNPGCANGAPGQTTGTTSSPSENQPRRRQPRITRFLDDQWPAGIRGHGPRNVTFNLADNNNGQAGTWAPWTAFNRINLYSCTPPGCPLTPTIAWAPGTAIYGVPLSSAQLSATASSTLLSGLTTTGTTGQLVTAPIPGTWSYNPPAGAVLSPGMNTLTATFTPTNVITSTTTAANAYKTYTIATASVPILVGTVTITTTAALSTISGGHQMVVTVKNTGNVTAPNVQLTSATLGSASSPSIPASLGDIPSGGVASATLTFPSSAGADGAGAVERLSGTYRATLL